MGSRVRGAGGARGGERGSYRKRRGKEMEGEGERGGGGRRFWLGFSWALRQLSLSPRTNARTGLPLGTVTVTDLPSACVPLVAPTYGACTAGVCMTSDGFRRHLVNQRDSSSLCSERVRSKGLGHSIMRSIELAGLLLEHLVPRALVMCLFSNDIYGHVHLCVVVNSRNDVQGPCRSAPFLFRRKFAARSSRSHSSISLRR